jgi:hypothetical protein
MTLEQLKVSHFKYRERVNAINENIKHLQRLKNQLYNEYIYQKISLYNYEGKINILNAALLELEYIKDLLIALRTNTVKEFIHNA